MTNNCVILLFCMKINKALKCKILWWCINNESPDIESTILIV